MSARRRSLRRTVASVVGPVALLAACGVPNDDDARVIPAEEIPFGLAPTTLPPASATTSTTVTASSIDAVVVTVVDGELVTTVVSRPVPLDLGALVDLLADPPDTAEGRTVLREGDVLAIEREGSLVRIDLAPGILDLPTSEQVLLIGQLVLTLTSVDGIGRVAFTVDDAPVSVPLPGGTTSDDPVRAIDVAALLADR